MFPMFELETPSARRLPRLYSAIGRRALGHEPVITRLMADALSVPGLLSLAAGFTDNSVLPAEAVRAAVDALRRDESISYLQYGINEGLPPLRKHALKLVGGYETESIEDLGLDQIMITNGSQQALYLAVQLLCEPGDIVLVEAPSYFVFLELLAGLGVRAMSLPMTPQGRVDVEALPAFFAKLAQRGHLQHVRMIYLMGVYANPSARCWDESVKRSLGRFLQEQPREIPVIEDMAYRETFFKHPHEAASVLSLPEWEGLPSLYLGTFTKPFATGIKVGFAISRDREWLQGMSRIKGHQDFGSSNFLQAVLAQVLEAGAYGTHLQFIRPHYARKMEVLDVALKEAGLEHLGWHWERPAGGLLMWLEGPPECDTGIASAMWQSALKERVIYVPGDLCFAEGQPHSGVRLSFGALSEELIPEAAQRFVRAAGRAVNSV